jgi:hypothetical protein
MRRRELSQRGLNGDSKLIFGNLVLDILNISTIGYEDIIKYEYYDPDQDQRRQ